MITFGNLYKTAVDNKTVPNKLSVVKQLPFTECEVNLNETQSLKLYVDTRMDVDAICKVVSRIANYFKAYGAKFVFENNTAYMMYHKMDAECGGACVDIGYKDYTAIAGIVFINQRDTLICEETLEHELIHLFDSMTLFSKGASEGIFPRSASVDINTWLVSDSAFIKGAIESVINDILEYCNDPREALVVEIMTDITGDQIKAFEYQGFSERVLTTINSVFEAKHISKKRAKSLMRQYIMLNRDNPKYKYLNHLARTLKAGKL